MRNSLELSYLDLYKLSYKKNSLTKAINSENSISFDFKKTLASQW